MPPRTETNRKTNIGVARAVPFTIFALIGYASWVLTSQICVNYLLNPPPSLSSRPRYGSTAAILTTYYLLLIATLISYARLLYTVFRHPGLIPRGQTWYVEKARRKQSKESRSEDEKLSESDPSDSKTPKEIRYVANEKLPFKVEDFWQRDVFVCNPDGRPPFCSHCYNWKPDRSHHCSELNRCVLKFDHFCPWVGGVVSETSFKFFIQFTFYAALYTLQILVVVAYYFAERRRQDGFLNAHWIVLLAIAALFFLFSGGMCMSTAQFALINSTTIENLNRKTKVWYLAVYVSPATIEEINRKGLAIPLISYPRPSEEQAQIHQVPNVGNSGSQRMNASVMRTFAILNSKPGENPFDTGPLNNFRDVMGYTVWEWLLPTKASPCFKHNNLDSLYNLGPAFDAMKSRIDLSTWQTRSSRSRKTRKSRSLSRRTVQDDAWVAMICMI